MILLYGLGLYALLGLVTAVAFVSVGVTQVLPYSMTIGARILVLPGAAALWPYVLVRWLTSRRPEARPHETGAPNRAPVALAGPHAGARTRRFARADAARAAAAMNSARGEHR